MKSVKKRKEYRAWMEKVYGRFSGVCQSCGHVGSQCHHIKPISSYPEEAFNVGNGITLCLDCHPKAHSRKGLWAGDLFMSCDIYPMGTTQGKHYLIDQAGILHEMV